MVNREADVGAVLEHFASSVGSAGTFEGSVTEAVRDGVALDLVPGVVQRVSKCSVVSIGPRPF